MRFGSTGYLDIRPHINPWAFGPRANMTWILACNTLYIKYCTIIYRILYNYVSNIDVMTIIQHVGHVSCSYLQTKGDLFWSISFSVRIQMISLLTSLSCCYILIDLSHSLKLVFIKFVLIYMSHIILITFTPRIHILKTLSI